MSNYVRNRNIRASHSRRDENHEENRRLKVTKKIEENLKRAREIIQNTELFPGLTEDEGVLCFTTEDVNLLRKESHRIRVNQKNTNVGLAFGSSLGVYSGGIAMAGMMVGVGSVVAATGGAAAVVGGISSVAAAISRSRSQAYTRTKIQSIVEKLNRLPDIISALITVSDLAPGEYGIENVLIHRLTNLTLEDLIAIKAKTNELVNVLSCMQTVDKNADLNSILEVLGKASLLLNTVNTIIDPNTVATVATVVATTSWLLQHYRGASQNYRNALQLIEKAILSTPTIINMLAKSGMLSANWSKLMNIAYSSPGIKVAEKVAEEVLERAGTKISSKAGAEVAEKVIQQTGTNVTSQAGTQVAGKVGGEALEQASTKVIGKVGGEVLEQASSKVAGKVGGEVLEQASSKVAGKVGGEVLEQASSKVAGKVGGEVLEQASSKVAGKVGGEVLEQASSKVAGKVGGEVLEQASSKVAGKVGGEFLEQASTKVAGKVGGEVLEQASSTVAGKVGEEVLEQAGSAVAGQGGNKVARKIGEEVAEQAANSSNVPGIVGTAAKVKYIRILCASVVIAGIVVDGITLNSALQNLYQGSPTDLSNFLISLGDVIEPLVP